MRPARLLAALAILLALGGCADLLHRGGEEREAADLLNYYGRVAALAPEEQLQEFRRARADFERETGDVQRLRLALLYALPRAGWRDEAQALQLVDALPAPPAGAASPLHDLALVMRDFIAERQRLSEEARRRLAERQRQLRDEHLRVEVLQKQLDALLAIDRETRRRGTHK